MESHDNRNNRKKVNADSIGIKEEVVEVVLQKLENFEQEKKFLEKDINLKDIATYLEINGKYASKIILHSRGKKIVPYINDLKNDHLIHLLKADKSYRKFNYESLTEEVGFGSVQNFIRAFKKYTTLTPIQFIKLLDETEKKEK